MTDERDNQMQPGLYDDDRLLACALGLEEDPELLAAAAADAELAARLEAMRADVAAVGAQVSAAVPEPAESYTDLSGEGWSGLREYFEAPPAAAPRSERRWWRVLAPVAALVVLAVVVGVIAINGGGTTGSSSSTSSSLAQSAADQATPAQGYSGSGATKSAATPAPELASVGERFRDELDRFAVVVLARARQVSGVVQRFAVLRIFKGSAPKVVELVVNDQPTDAGRLHVLMLEPTASPAPEDGSPWPMPESPTPVAGSPLPATISPEPETASPEPIPSLAAVDVPGTELPVAYTYQGQPTAEWELAPGTDPSSVVIKIP